MRYPRPYPHVHHPGTGHKRRDRLCAKPVPGMLLEKEVSAVHGRLASRDTFVEPFFDFRKQPHHPILAELDPLRELPRRLKPCDVLRTIRNATNQFQLLLGYDLFFVPSHRTTPLDRERRRSGWTSRTGERPKNRPVLP